MGMYISLSHAATISCPDMVAFVDVFVFPVFDSFDGHVVFSINGFVFKK